MVTDLASWLLAQIADDEAAARAASINATRLRDQAERVANIYGDPDPPEDDIGIVDALWFTAQDAAEWIARHDPARVLAECAAKRKLLSFIDEMAQHVRAPNGEEPFALTWMRWALAEPYADRPGFDPVWKLP